jgi:hypothetical protein
MKVYRYIITVLAILLLPVVACANAGYKYKDRADFDRIFDEIARNFGAVEGAYYTYTLEFEKVPTSLQEMIDTGHLRVIWTNPYTGKPVQQSEGNVPGDITWVVEEDGDYISTATSYISWNNPNEIRWMKKSIWPYTHEELHKWVFGDDASREEKLVRVYCLQMEDAIDSFEQRFGRMPNSYEELGKGDVNVAYINPFTGKQVKDSGDLSPGDFRYERIDDKHFSIVGWGKTKPVYFMSNDRSRDSFEWNGSDTTNKTKAEFK